MVHTRRNYYSSPLLPLEPTTSNALVEVEDDRLSFPGSDTSLRSKASSFVEEAWALANQYTYRSRVESTPITDFEEMLSFGETMRTEQRFSGKPGTMGVKEFKTRVATAIRKAKQRKPEFNDWDAFELLPDLLEGPALQEWEGFNQEHAADIRQVEGFYGQQRRLLELIKEGVIDTNDVPQASGAAPEPNPTRNYSDMFNDAALNDDEGEDEREQGAGASRFAPGMFSTNRGGAGPSNASERASGPQAGGGLLTKHERALGMARNILQTPPPIFVPIERFQKHLEDVFGGLRADLLEQLRTYKREAGDTALTMKNRLQNLADQVGGFNPVQLGRVFFKAQPQNVQTALATLIMLQYRGKPTLLEVYETVMTYEASFCESQVQEVSAELTLGGKVSTDKKGKETAGANFAGTSGTQTPGSRGPVDVSNKICNRCGGKGHLKKTCSSAPDNSASNNNDNQALAQQSNGGKGKKAQAQSGNNSSNSSQQKSNQGGKGKQQAAYKGVCTHCKKENSHAPDDCWFKFPEKAPAKWKKGEQRRGSNNQPQHAFTAPNASDANVNQLVKQQQDFLVQMQSLISAFQTNHSFSVYDDAGSEPNHQVQAMASMPQGQDYHYDVFAATQMNIPSLNQTESRGDGGERQLFEPKSSMIPGVKAAMAVQLRPRARPAPNPPLPTPSAAVRTSGREMDELGRGRMPHSFTVAEDSMNDVLGSLQQASHITTQTPVASARTVGTDSVPTPARAEIHEHDEPAAPPSCEVESSSQTDSVSTPARTETHKHDEPAAPSSCEVESSSQIDYTLAAIRCLNAPVFSGLHALKNATDVSKVLQRALEIARGQVPIDETLLHTAYLSQMGMPGQQHVGMQAWMPMWDHFAPALREVLNASIGTHEPPRPAPPSQIQLDRSSPMPHAVSDASSSRSEAATNSNTDDELLQAAHSQEARDAIAMLSSEPWTVSLESQQTVAPLPRDTVVEDRLLTEGQTAYSATTSSPARAHPERLGAKAKVISIQNERQVFALQVPNGAPKFPVNVLLDSGAEPVLLGKRTTALLGLTAADIVPCPFKISTSAGGQEVPVGWTRDPLLLTFRGDTREITPFATRCVVTESETYDVLLGMHVMYPLGIGHDPWEETAWLRPDYAEGGGRKAFFPIRMVAEASPNQSSGQRSDVAIACNALCLPIGEDLLEGNTSALDEPPPSSMEPGDSESGSKAGSHHAFLASPATVRTAQMARTPDPPPPWGTMHQLQLQATKFTQYAHRRPTAFASLQPLTAVARASLPNDLTPLDTSTVQLATPPEGITVVELFGGICSGLTAILQAGISVKKYVYVDKDRNAQAVAQQVVASLTAKYPQQLPYEATTQFQSVLPQDVQDIHEPMLQALGEVDLVIAGWPCQGHSQASGHGQGLADDRSRLFWHLIRILQWWQQHQPHKPVAYIMENVHPLSNVIGQRDLQVIRHFIGQEVVMDAAGLGSYAHRLRLKWTNLMPAAELQQAYQYITRPSGRTVDSILDPGHESQKVRFNDTAPMATVNWTGGPRYALPTLMARSASHAFRNGQAGLIREVATGRLIEPNANERERAMGFATGTTHIEGIQELERRRLLGLAMDVNAMTWVVALCHAYQQQFQQPDHDSSLPESFSVPPPPSPRRPIRPKVVSIPGPTAAETLANNEECKAIFHTWLREEEVILPDDVEPSIAPPVVCTPSCPVPAFMAPFTSGDMRRLEKHFHLMLCDPKCTGDCATAAARVGANAHRQAQKEELRRRKEKAQQASSPAATLAATTAAGPTTGP
jgi:hypothetical protein